MRNLVRFAYESIESPEKRHDFIRVFAEVVDAPAALIKVEDPQLRWTSVLMTYGIDQGTIDSYTHHYVALNPWALRGVSTPGEVRTSDELLSERELRETEFYHGWMRPRGWMHTAAVSLTTIERGRAILVAYRPPNHLFTEKELAILNGLAPHLATAAQIGKTLMDLKNTINRFRSGALQMDVLAGLGLTVREARIALARFNGQSVKEIAHKAGLAPDTVKGHLKGIHKKLDVPNRDGLKRFLLERFRQ
jgi:DNA-binding CsgD family transcriptional regulator